MCLEKHFECVCLSLVFQASCLRESQIVCSCVVSWPCVCTVYVSVSEHFECVCLSLTLVSSLVSACVPISMHLVGYHHQLFYVWTVSVVECECLCLTLFVCVVRVCTCVCVSFKRVCVYECECVWRVRVCEKCECVWERVCVWVGVSVCVWVCGLCRKQKTVDFVTQNKLYLGLWKQTVHKAVESHKLLVYTWSTTYKEVSYTHVTHTHVHTLTQIIGLSDTGTFTLYNHTTQCSHS